MNLLVDERGAPISIVLTGANRHDKVSAIELMVSLVVKRPAQKEQHLCADKAYDSDDLGSSQLPGATRRTSRSILEEKTSSFRRMTTHQEGFIQRGDG